MSSFKPFIMKSTFYHVQHACSDSSSSFANINESLALIGSNTRIGHGGTNGERRGGRGMVI